MDLMDLLQSTGGDESVGQLASAVGLPSCAPDAEEPNDTKEDAPENHPSAE